MIYVVLGLIGAVMGSVYLYGRGDFMLGGAIGLMVAAVINQRNALLAMGKRLDAMETRMAGLAAKQPIDDREPSAAKRSTDQTETAGGPGETVAAATEDRFPASSTPAPPTTAPTATAVLPSLDLELSDAALSGIDAPSEPSPPDQLRKKPGGGGGAVVRFRLSG